MSRVSFFLQVFFVIFLSIYLEGGQFQHFEEFKRLLHYGDKESRVISKSFFLSENGFCDPLAELNTTIDLLNSQDGEEIAKNFPARYLWIKKQGFQVPSFDLENFLDLSDFVNSFQKDFIYLVFVSEHIDSPASSFGHLILAFQDREKPLLSAETIHFAAEMEIRGENFFKYAFNGLTGNYHGYFFRMPLFMIKTAYTIGEQRDLFFYRLDLPSERIEMLIYHLYELRKAKYAYYFLSENCAYQIASILKIAYGEDSPHYQYGFPILPMDVLNAYQEKVVERFSIDATLKKAENLFDEMTPIEKKEYIDVIEGNREPCNELSDHVKEILYIKNEYHFRRFGNPLVNYEKMRDLKFSPSKSAISNLLPCTNNEKHIFSLGAYSDEISNGLCLRYFMIGRDRYLCQVDKMQESDLVFMDTKVKIVNDRTVSLHSLDILREKALFNRSRLSSPLSWAINLGLNRQNSLYKPSWNFSLGIGLGRGSLKKKVGFSTLFEVGLQSSSREGIAYISPSLELIYYPFDTVKLGFFTKKKYSVGGQYLYREHCMYLTQDFKACSIISEFSGSNSLVKNSVRMIFRFKL